VKEITRTTSEVQRQSRGRRGRRGGGWIKERKITTPTDKSMAIGSINEKLYKKEKEKGIDQGTVAS